MSLWSSVSKALHIDPPAGEIPTPLEAPATGRHRIKIPLVLDPALISAGTIPEPTDHLFMNHADFERFSNPLPNGQIAPVDRALSASLLAKAYPEASAFGSPEAMNEMALWTLARPLNEKVFHGDGFTATITPDSTPYHPAADISFENGQKLHVECTPRKNMLSIGFLQNNENSYFARLEFNFNDKAEHQIEFHRRYDSGFTWSPQNGLVDTPIPHEPPPAARPYLPAAPEPEATIDKRDENKPTGLFADEMLTKNDFFFTSSNPFD